MYGRYPINGQGGTPDNFDPRQIPEQGNGGGGDPRMGQMGGYGMQRQQPMPQQYGGPQGGPNLQQLMMQLQRAQSRYGSPQNYQMGMRPQMRQGSPPMRPQMGMRPQQFNGMQGPPQRPPMQRPQMQMRQQMPQYGGLQGQAMGPQGYRMNMRGPIMD